MNIRNSDIRCSLNCRQLLLNFNPKFVATHRFNASAMLDRIGVVLDDVKQLQTSVLNFETLIVGIE